MGKIKSRLIKRTANTLIEKGVEVSESFEHNKKVLGNTMPSKKLRNRIAGYIARLKKMQKKEKEKIQLKE